MIEEKVFEQKKRMNLFVNTEIFLFVKKICMSY